MRTSVTPKRPHTLRTSSALMRAYSSGFWARTAGSRSDSGLSSSSWSRSLWVRAPLVTVTTVTESPRAAWMPQVAAQWVKSWGWATTTRMRRGLLLMRSSVRWRVSVCRGCDRRCGPGRARGRSGGALGGRRCRRVARGPGSSAWCTRTAGSGRAVGVGGVEGEGVVEVALAGGQLQVDDVGFVDLAGLHLAAEEIALLLYRPRSAAPAGGGCRPRPACSRCRRGTRPRPATW